MFRVLLDDVELSTHARRIGRPVTRCKADHAAETLVQYGTASRDFMNLPIPFWTSPMMHWSQTVQHVQLC